MKKFICLLMVIAMALGLAACGGKNEPAPATEASEKVITLATVSTSGGLDPSGFALDMWTEYAKQCTDGLVSYDSNGELVYESAESIETSEDGLVWTFHLRDNCWSDGSKVTAADFTNTMMNALNPENGNAIFANMLFNIVGAEEYNNGTGAPEDVKAVAVDDNTLEITLKSPCSYFLKMMSMPVFYPSKAGVATLDDPTWATTPGKSLGNGAFYLESYQDGVGYTVVKNPYYYQADKVGLDKIVTQFIVDQTASLSAYKNGEVDVVADLPDYILDEYTEEDGLFIWTMLTTKYMMPNLDVEVLKDVRVRKAMSLALNRTDICAAIGGDYIPTVNYVADAMLSNCSDKKFKDEVDPLIVENAEEAQKLLAEAGYPNGEGFPKLTYRYPNSEKDSLMAQGIQAQLKQVLNIEIELVGEEDKAVSTDKKEGNFELIRNSWTADYNDPINFLNLFVTGSGSNYNHVADPDFDAAIAASDAASDPVERNKYLHEAQKILVSDQAYVIPVTTQIYIYLMNTNIKGITTNDKGEAMYRFAYLAE